MSAEICRKIQAVLMIAMVFQVEGYQIHLQNHLHTHLSSKQRVAAVRSGAKVAKLFGAGLALWPSLHVFDSQVAFLGAARGDVSSYAGPTAYGSKGRGTWASSRALQPFPSASQLALVLRPSLRKSLAPAGCAGKDGTLPGKPDGKDGFDGFAVQVLLFLIYFAMQSGMNVYMKWLSAKVQIARDLIGVPASFLVTSAQQIVCFALIMGFIFLSRLLGRPYRPKRLEGSNEVCLVLFLSLAFSLNIGLNLFSLSLIPLSMSLIIRACAPLPAVITQTLLLRKQQDTSGKELVCLILGVISACAVVIAQSGNTSAKASSAFFLGVYVAIASLFCGAFVLVFTSILGTSVKLSPVDTVYHMARPIAILTAVIGSCVKKPVPPTWAVRVAPEMTDLQIFWTLWQVSPQTFAAIGGSGLLAFVYNIFQTFLVVKLSPATTAFAGNFNKAMTIFLSLVMFRGELPKGFRGIIVVFSILGNIAAFTSYNVLETRRKK